MDEVPNPMLFDRAAIKSSASKIRVTGEDFARVAKDQALGVHPQSLTIEDSALWYAFSSGWKLRLWAARRQDALDFVSAVPEEDYILYKNNEGSFVYLRRTEADDEDEEPDE